MTTFCSSRESSDAFECLSQHDYESELSEFDLSSLELEPTSELSGLEIALKMPESLKCLASVRRAAVTLSYSRPDGRVISAEWDGVTKH